METIDRFLPKYSLWDTVYITATSFPPLVLAWGWYFIYSIILYYVAVPVLGYFYTFFILIVLLSVILYVLRNYLLVVKPYGPSRTFTLSSATYGKNGQAIDFKNPATGESTGSFTSYTPEDVNSIVSLAHKAQVEWAQTSFAERAAVLSDLMQHIIQNQNEICKKSMQDTGKTYLEALYGEILTSCAKLDYVINNGQNILSTESRSPPLWLLTKSAWVEYLPLGVIGIIVPWNYPFHNVLSAVVTALFSGNAAVVKVSEFATSSKDYFENIFRSVLCKRGHSPDLVTLISGYGPTGEALIRSDVNHVFFIGSPQTGQKVMRAASDNTTPVTLELGGKDPFIVFDDVVMDQVIQVALRGVFVNNGQNCIASERIYVHSKIYDEFVDKAQKAVKALRSGASILGEECDIGSVTMELGIKKCLELVQDAEKHGAKILAGGRVKPNNKQHTLFFEPTILVNVTHDMKCVQEEAFGPLMLIIKFNTEDEVIKMANDSKYALGCSVFSQDKHKAERIGRKIASGMLTVNDFGVGYLVQSLPFGGVKASGFGKFNGPEGLRSFCNVKACVTGRFGGGLLVPKFTTFPVVKEAKEVVEGLIGVLYEAGASNKIRAVKKLKDNATLLS